MSNRGAVHDPLVEGFKAAGQMPVLWQTVARDLICAANVLMERKEAAWHQHRDIAAGGKEMESSLFHASLALTMMLYGLALENLVKGLLVAQGVDATSTGKFNKKLKGHDLPRLFDDACVPMTPEDLRLLEQLYLTIESGKYPVGLKPARSPLIVKSGFVYPRDLHHIERLLQTLDRSLRDAQPDEALPEINLLALCRHSPVGQALSQT